MKNIYNTVNDKHEIISCCSIRGFNAERHFNFFITISFLFFFSSTLLADGLIIPDNKSYPAAYLKNKSTEVSVEINGLIAETVVIQEFENEWYNAVDGVYSFPLPANARTTRLLYNYGDTMVDAILKVQQQSTNPGTGEGGTVAEINKYMGSNALRIQLKGIPAYGTKIVELHYISLLNQFNGTYEYRYPLNTGSFLKHPLDYLKLKINVKSSQKITSCQLKSHAGAQIQLGGNSEANLNFNEAKAYAATDFVFEYSVKNSSFNVDLFSWKPDSADGYFAFIGHAPITPGDSVLPSNIVFLFGNSSGMVGNKLNQSKIALSLSLDKLSPNDSFNIVLFNSRVINWKSGLVPATKANIASAKSYVDEIKGEYGSNLQDGIKNAFDLLKNKNKTASVLIFSDGRSLVDPFAVEQLNKLKTGLFFIAIGNDVDRARLETVAALNYGFVTYLNEDDLLGTEMAQIFEKINRPILRNLNIAYDNPITSALYPTKMPAIFAGSDIIQTGRYKIPGLANIYLNGFGLSNALQLNFSKDFSFSSSNAELSRKLWTKFAIDQLEAKILIYGENDSLKNPLIELSLANNMRCRYTAYIEDTAYIYKPGDDVGHTTSVINPAASNQLSKLISAYPNPFSYSTKLHIYISKADLKKAKVIKIFDNYGRFVGVIDITDLSEGMHEVELSSLQFGHKLKGTLIVVLEINSVVAGKLNIVAIN